MAKTTNTNTDSQVIDLEDTTQGAPAGVSAAVAPAPVAAEAKPQSVGHDVGLSGKKIAITINDGKEDIDRLPVFISINGYAYQIKRNERVVVPEELVEILNNASENRSVVEKDGIREYAVNRFSFIVHGPVPQ